MFIKYVCVYTRTNQKHRWKTRKLNIQVIKSLPAIQANCDIESHHATFHNTSSYTTIGCNVTFLWGLQPFRNKLFINLNQVFAMSRRLAL